MSLAAISIALSGANAAVRRLENSAANVANVSTTGTVPDGTGASTAYQPMVVSQQSVPGGGVTTTLVPQRPGFALRYDPTSPDADPRGMVGAPDIDLATEAVTQLTARLDYRAALKVMQVADEMLQSTLDLTS
ncbi:flagellar basal body rod protein FlgC [Prosthecodimorpha staleyi]|uniref:Flagellar biosynthesis protein FlgC n=1 Tax=Prosthecodimorpha staleyi TaxID=2840188 RepID=A0A947D9U0_9HYPH|nr:flagellar basal body rod C-terminal domain-containing protein [Prosthecodimorpha staleyi]MBT9292854.1 flagellar biosynthesis protein FlgC [Prosthecodimorpha staleyi]